MDDRWKLELKQFLQEYRRKARVIQRDVTHQNPWRSCHFFAR